MKLGSHINFFGTIGTACIVLWGFSQSKAKPQYSPEYVRVESFSKSGRSHPKPGRKAAINIAPGLQRARIKITPHLVKDVTIKKLCKLREYAVIAPEEPVNQLASKENVENANQPDRPAEVKVTPLIRDVMNKIRPKQITGTIRVEGKQYEFGSGGHGQSIPYGDYLITPDAVGSWGSRHGAIGVANGTIADPKLHRDRDGIELHAATNSKLETNGCVSIKKDQWPEFRKQVLTMVKENKRVYLHVSDQGASVSTSPLEFIGEPIAKPTFRDVLSLLEAPPEKGSDKPVAPLRRVGRSETHDRESKGDDGLRYRSRPSRLARFTNRKT